MYSVFHAVIPSLQTAIVDKDLVFPYFTAIDKLSMRGFTCLPRKDKVCGDQFYPDFSNPFLTRMLCALKRLPLWIVSSLSYTHILADTYLAPAYTTPVQVLPPTNENTNTTVKEELKQFFSTVGEIVYVKIPVAKGCGFVLLATRYGAKLDKKIYGPNAGVDYKDNQWRFSLLCQAALEAHRVLNLNNNKYFSGPYGEDVIFIANDWHTGILSCYLKSMYQSRGLGCFIFCRGRCYLYRQHVTLL
ncbi:hypothetical protein F3Y22_tig00005406pilonHSYRG00280 [Hibiscus syriacus]|uniref:Starch synthase catalytic domain-containing protein n=1 Tax=Hibiscus syriacus TaxID=106335 RepID=A0A6A3CJF2_HIBSY|nr:hypothetical protein F3Y22_tig00005406pilonHSYRG00280 [Hibiscus syriacus]